MLTKDLSPENVLLSKRDGLSRKPQAIVYNALDHQSYSYLMLLMTLGIQLIAFNYNNIY